MIIFAPRKSEGRYLSPWKSRHLWRKQWTFRSFILLKSWSVHASAVTDFFSPFSLNSWEKSRFFSLFAANRSCNYKLKFPYPVPSTVSSSNIPHLAAADIFPSLVASKSRKFSDFRGSLGRCSEGNVWEQEQNNQALILPFRHSLGVFGMTCWVFRFVPKGWDMKPGQHQAAKTNVVALRTYSLFYWGVTTFSLLLLHCWVRWNL